MRTAELPVALGGWAAVGAGIGVLVFLGTLVPFVTVGGTTSRALVEDSALWFWLVPALAAVAGGAAAAAGRADGLGVAAGVGLTHFFLSGISFRIITLATASIGTPRVTPFLGAFLWGAAMAVTVAVVARAIQLSALDIGNVHPAVAGAGLAAAAVLVVGIARPPVDGVGVWDHLWPGDTWIGVLNLGLVGSPLLAGGWLALTRSRVALGALAGVASWWLVIWLDGSSVYRESASPFVSFLSGTFAWITVGIVATTAIVIVGLGLPRLDRPGARMGFHPLALVGLGALVVVTVLALANRDTEPEPVQIFAPPAASAPAP